ncbi:hypothetical protein, partial [Paenibacillus dendritiformis]|uniref:hypothetical protein n=1 Tax=Paenibacillus dendritiformis TaxID=130049 RepID=UPI001C255AA0
GGNDASSRPIMLPEGDDPDDTPQHPTRSLGSRKIRAYGTFYLRWISSPGKKLDLRRAESQCLDEENGPSPPLRKKQWFLNSLSFAGIPVTGVLAIRKTVFLQLFRQFGR